MLPLLPDITFCCVMHLVSFLLLPWPPEITMRCAGLPFAYRIVSDRITLVFCFAFRFVLLHCLPYDFAFAFPRVAFCGPLWPPVQLPPVAARCLPVPAFTFLPQRSVALGVPGGVGRDCIARQQNVRGE